MEALAKAMNGKGNVAILLGDLANESTRDRTKGVEEVVAKYPNIKIVQKQTAKFTRNDAVDVVSNWMTSGEDIQAIASNNDEMAIGALQALGKNPNHILIMRRGWHPGRAADAEERQDDRHHLPGCERPG